MKRDDEVLNRVNVFLGEVSGVLSILPFVVPATVVSHDYFRELHKRVARLDEELRAYRFGSESKGAE